MARAAAAAFATTTLYNTAFTGYRRIYMTEPRSYRLTTTLEF